MRIGLLTVLLAARSAAAAPNVPAIEKLMEEQRAQLHIPGASFAIVLDDKVVVLGAQGLRDVDGKQAVTPDTVFPIGSCTKAFTAMAVALAQEAGALSLDDSVHRWLPGVKFADAETNELVTLRDLLSHRTGLKAYADLSAVAGNLTRDEYIRAALGAAPVGKLREKFQYSNAAITAAGEAVARADRMAWEKVIETKILAPLGMTASRSSSFKLSALRDGATGYVWDGKAWKATPVVESLQVMAPAGAVASTARDMTRWVRMLANRGTLDGKRFVSEATFADITAPHTAINDTLAYALGWVVYTWNGHRVIEHNGGSEGLSAIVSIVPERRAAFVVLANISPSQLTSIGVLGSKLWPLILDEKPSANAAPKTPSRAAPPPPAAPTVAAVDLPTIDDLLAHAIRAQGGTNLARHTSMRMVATGAYVNQGVAIQETVLAVDGKRLEDEVYSAVGKRIGRVRTYFDGSHGAQQTTFGQDETNKPEDDARVRRESSLHPLVDARTLYKKVTVDRKVALDGGGEAYVIVLAPASGNNVELYVSARTYLVVRRDSGGESTRYSDFRSVDGEVVPFAMTTQGALGDKTLAATSVTFNTPIPPTAFAPAAKLVP